MRSCRAVGWWSAAVARAVKWRQDRRFLRRLKREEASQRRRKAKEARQAAALARRIEAVGRSSSGNDNTGGGNAPSPAAGALAAANISDVLTGAGTPRSTGADGDGVAKAAAIGSESDSKNMGRKGLPEDIRSADLSAGEVNDTADTAEANVKSD